MTPYQLFTESPRSLPHSRSGGRAPPGGHPDLTSRPGSPGAGPGPEPGARPPGRPRAVDPESERYLLFSVVVDLLPTAVSRHRPVLLVLDDLQWADRGQPGAAPSRGVVGPRRAGAPVVGTYRDTELGPIPGPLTELLGALHRQATSVTKIDLQGLDGVGVTDLMQAVAGHPSSTTRPCALATVVRAGDRRQPVLCREGAPRPGRDRRYRPRRLWAVGGQGGPLDLRDRPTPVREVISALFVRLGAEAVRALRPGLGDRAGLRLRPAGPNGQPLSEDDLLEILEGAASVALVSAACRSTVGGYRFTHALIQHTLDQEFRAPTRRARSHRSVAEALEDLSGQDPAPRPGARAGRHLAQRHPPVEIAARRSSTPGWPPTPPWPPSPPPTPCATTPRPSTSTPRLSRPRSGHSALDLAIGLGTAQRQTGDPAFRDTLLDASRRAADLDDTERLVAAALANDRGLVSSCGESSTPTRSPILEMALDRLPADDPDRALVLATLCCGTGPTAARSRRRRALADEAIAIAQRVR